MCAGRAQLPSVEAEMKDPSQYPLMVRISLVLIASTPASLRRATAAAHAPTIHITAGIYSIVAACAYAGYSTDVGGAGQ